MWSPTERRNWFDDDAETIMHWRERPTGQHMELGIAETNLVGLIGELGATWSRWGQPLFPIGVLYDPFVERAWNPGPTVSTPVGNPSSLARRQESPWPLKAVHTSRSRHPQSGSNSPGASATNRRSPPRWNGSCWTASTDSADPTAPPPTSACPPDRSSRRWRRCPKTQPPENAAAATSWPGHTRSGPQVPPGGLHRHHGRPGHRSHRGR